MMVTMPGVPMIFAGDELGMEGRWGEDARTPHPWHKESDWDHDFLRQYKALINLRSTSDALAVGGMRWVHVEDDAIVYLRETAEERYLVAVTRNPVATLAIDANAFGIRTLEQVFGFDAVLRADRVEISAPTAGGGIWRVS
jgi:alpha-glucosidase